MPNMGCNLLLLNGHVDTFDGRVPKGQAVAIRDPRIAAVGDSDGIRDLASHGDWQIVDVGGRPILPGFTKCHLNLLCYALGLVDVGLNEMREKRDLLAAVAERARTLNPGEWLRGLG
jgi:predicted amidohydrolase YtcJ